MLIHVPWAHQRLPTSFRFTPNSLGCRSRCVDCSLTADVDDGTPLEVRLGFPQDLMGNRRGIRLVEQYLADYVHKRVTFSPAEVAARGLAGCVAHMYQEGDDSIGHGRALSAKHPIAADPCAPHSSTSSNSEGSSTSIFRSRTTASSGMWLYSRCSISFRAYSSGSSPKRRWAMMCISSPG
jgi:hypothetical protein